MTLHPDDVAAAEMQISVSRLADSPRMIAQEVITAIDIARAKRLSAEVKMAVEDLRGLAEYSIDEAVSRGLNETADMLLFLSAAFTDANARAERMKAEAVKVERWWCVEAAMDSVEAGAGREILHAVERACAAIRARGKE